MGGATSAPALHTVSMQDPLKPLNNTLSAHSPCFLEAFTVSPPSTGVITFWPECVCVSCEREHVGGNLIWSCCLSAKAEKSAWTRAYICFQELPADFYIHSTQVVTYNCKAEESFNGQKWHLHNQVQVSILSKMFLLPRFAVWTDNMILLCCLCSNAHKTNLQHDQCSSIQNTSKWLFLKQFLLTNQSKRFTSH